MDRLDMSANHSLENKENCHSDGLVSNNKMNLVLLLLFIEGLFLNWLLIVQRYFVSTPARDLESTATRLRILGTSFWQQWARLVRG